LLPDDPRNPLADRPEARPGRRRRLSQQVLSGTGRLNPLPDDYEQAYHLAATYTDQPITLFDAVLAVLSRRLQLPVWTYGHHFDVMHVSVWR
jgi:hypothetical protein